MHSHKPTNGPTLLPGPCVFIAKHWLLIAQGTRPVEQADEDVARPNARMKTIYGIDKSTAMPIWGGIECTVNRVGEVYQDQVRRTGHHSRLSDLDRVAELGIRTLRYPVIWERTAPYQADHFLWEWPDERLTYLHQLGIRPIVGLVHHGCGPQYATYDQVAFERELPRFARRVAERYPWVDAYTPINEPLTTARFSGLYGHWYPHGKSDHLFVHLLLRQCRATVEAMRAIREVRPDAQLVQTDDLGYTHATLSYQYQADFDNERRWLGWDLLCGRVTPDHALWTYLRRSGATIAQLWYHIDNPCPPTIIGINHYVTSERFLAVDPRQPDRYTDTEVVRAAPELRLGVGQLLQQAWERYGLPLAITEAHLSCTVDEQMRWLAETVQQAEWARQQGADVRAVTAWALFGLRDWHCLLTRQENCYEPGVFTLHNDQPRATELTRMVQQLAGGVSTATLTPNGPGWWQAEEVVY